MRIFVSHSSSDFEIAKKVCDLLEVNGHTCFFAPRDIRTGHEYAEEIMRGIEASDTILLLLSKNANESPHVLREVERAVSKHIKSIVYKIEEVELSKSMEYFLMMNQWVSTKPGADYQEIVECINGMAEREKQKSDFSTGQKSKKRFGAGILLGLVVALIILVLGVIICIKALSDSSGTGSGEKSVQTTEIVSEQQISLGDRIIFGKYNEEPIEWRVLKISEDGKEALVVSEHILTMKAFDAAESGKYNDYEGNDYWGKAIEKEEADLQHFLRGNNMWNTSNIRTWLNSSAENVVYEGQPPSVSAMSEMVNGYDTEPGFLSNFSTDEMGAIVETDIMTGNIATKDKVFLLSGEELDYFETANVNMKATPTKAALEQDASNWYEAYSLENGVEDYYWWLRDAVSTSQYEAYVVSNSYTSEKMISQSVGLEGFGIRPAMTVDLNLILFDT